ncbi:SMI1/KNR4 family protein [Streptomyces amritsarensis]|nr:SMI1/KNR4 family protein [Streptomyces amritsarensis]
MIDQRPRLPSMTVSPGGAPTSAAKAADEDLELLERTLRERLPDAIGATEGEITAVEARLGMPLSDELKVLYRVVRARSDDFGEDEEYDYEMECQVNTAVGCELFGLDYLYSIDAEARHPGWNLAAATAGSTTPGAAVQNLAGSTGWIAFGTNGGDEYVVDLTPGPAGHIGQVILVDHEQSVGAELVADSLTDFVVGRRKTEGNDRRLDQPPVVAQVDNGRRFSKETASAVSQIVRDA